MQGIEKNAENIGEIWGKWMPYIIARTVIQPDTPM